METCCALSKRDTLREADATDTLPAGRPNDELVGACPADANPETHTWDDEDKKCLKSVTTMKFGDYDTQTAEVVSDSECCNRGKTSTPAEGTLH
jgi:hypothetical protein